MCNSLFPSTGVEAHVLHFSFEKWRMWFCSQITYRNLWSFFNTLSNDEKYQRNLFYFHNLMKKYQFSKKKYVYTFSINGYYPYMYIVKWKMVFVAIWYSIKNFWSCKYRELSIAGILSEGSSETVQMHWLVSNHCCRLSDVLKYIYIYN